MLNSLCTNILPLEISIHLTMIFLVEGQKSLFRAMYSILKCNKKFILNIDNKNDFIKKI